MRASNVTALPPTLGIKDPAMRAWADAFTNAWSKRNGQMNDQDGERFVRLNEINGLAGKAVADAFSGGVVGGASGSFGQNPTAPQINQAIDNLADSIRKSLLYQLLEQNLSLPQLDKIRANLEGAINDAFTYIGSETTERVSKDHALAEAVNTVWSHMGGTDAVIQDSELAAVTPNTAQATKWDQVVAAVTDPNTGNINAASIKEELNTYANSADGTFNALYSVRAQLSVAGQTVVGGFGLAATAGAGSAEGPTIDFGVRADRFFIAATSSTPNAATQIAQGSSIPFMVLTSSQVVNGVTYAPGVYIKKAVIGDATIGNAQIANAAITTAKIGAAQITNALIADAQITTAKIGVAQIDTLRIGANQVTVPWSFSSGVTTSINTAPGPTFADISGGVQCFGGVMFVFGSAWAEAVGDFSPGGDADPIFADIPIKTQLYRDGTLLAETIGAAISAFDSPGAGVFTYTLRISIPPYAPFGNNYNSAEATIHSRGLAVLETRR